ncbi:MAG TPA: DUF5131 family protein [bacterium]|nr:DUF5131 family protein [bacterium]
MNRTNIPYLTHSWSPTKGCTCVSPGCRFCWAKQMSKRLAGMNDRGYDKDDPFAVTMFLERLNEPLSVKKPAIVGVSFMGDLWHDLVSWNFQYSVFECMLLAPRHTFMILTKRPENMRKAIRNIYIHLERNYYKENIKLPLKNLWLGVSVENPDNMWRVKTLLDTPAARHWISVEPMLEPINLNLCIECQSQPGECYEHNKLDLIVCGCESGKNRRPCNIDWVRSLRDQCKEANVPFYLKQLEQDGQVVEMPLLDGKVYNELPQQ